MRITSLFPLFLIGCATTHQPLSSQPKVRNLVSVIFSIEDDKGNPYDISSVYEGWKDDWKQEDGLWHDYGRIVYNRGISSDLNWILVDSKPQRPDLYEYKLTTDVLEPPPPSTHTWLRLSDKPGKQEVAFPKSIRTPERMYEVMDPIRTVDFINGGIERLVIKPLPTVNIDQMEYRNGGYFTLSSIGADIPLQKMGFLKLNPEDVGEYRVSWKPSGADNHYALMCTYVIRDVGVPSSIPTKELCRGEGDETHPDCICDSATDENSVLHISMENGIIRRRIEVTESAPKPPEDLALVINNRRAVPGDTIQLTHGVDLKVSVLLLKNWIAAEN